MRHTRNGNQRTWIAATLSAGLLAAGTLGAGATTASASPIPAHQGSLSRNSGPVGYEPAWPAQDGHPPHADYDNQDHPHGFTRAGNPWLTDEPVVSRGNEPGPYEPYQYQEHHFPRYGYAQHTPFSRE